MLRVVAHKSAGAAQKYYTEGLKREDYYSEKQEIVGKWHGKSAALLGLSGDVDREQFATMVENRHPVSGERLTSRTKEGRRVGYDFNFHAPKSLSVLYAMTQDKNVLRVFREAVAQTMTELEERAETRVRQKGGRGDRLTGNLAWAEFVHFTSRPVGGIPDPHLHVHCFTFNATFDQVEGAWKAVQFGSLKKEAHYAEAAFHSRLTEALSKLGYTIERRKNGWEIKGMPASVIAKFSRRTAQIERLAEEMGIKDAKAKDALGAASREGKRHGLTFSDLLAAWSVRLTDEEKAQISKVCYDKGLPRLPPVTAKEAMDFALAKVFERRSVAERGHILAEALRFGFGHINPQAVKEEFASRELLGRKIGDEHICTSVEVLAEEISLINFVRSGRNTALTMGGGGKLAIASHLSAEQQAAVRHILTSRDQVIALRGGAGVGKTTLMKDAVSAIEKQGLKVYAFAPSAVASRETLREAGFANADTVAQLMLNTKLQKEIRGQVIWIDEAGLLGVRDLWRVMELAGNDTRVILTGDTAQHAPVARGDAFRLLQEYAGLKVAEVTQIRRQELEEYRRAIESLSKGDLRTAFRRLDALGAFVEIDDDERRYRELAADYIALGGKRCDFPLVVSPTHAEGGRVTAAIREARSEAGQLGAERKFLQYHNLQWEEAERTRIENYRPGLVVQFHQNSRGITRGALFRVTGRTETGAVEMRGEKGETRLLPLKEAKKFLVYQEREIALAKGDLLRITRNAQSEDGKRLNNGNVFAIEKFTKSGEIILSNGARLAADHGHFAYGYCQTSHSSQSKSVRHVLVAQSEDSFLAASKEQFYVSCSRGKQTIRIYTDNRRGLQEAVGNSSSRMAAIELAGLTQKELSTMMQSEMGARQWRDAVESRRGLDKSKTFVENLAQQRRIDPAKKQDAMDWRGYIEMRRNLVSSDGRNRSKGHPAGTSKGKAGHKGKTVPKISLHSDALVQKHKAAHEAKKLTEEKGKQEPLQKHPEPPTRKALLAKAYESAAGHFRKVADKVAGRAAKQPGQVPPTPGKRTQPPAARSIQMGNAKIMALPQSNTKRVGEHAAKQKAVDAGKKASAPAKIKQPVKAAAPPPPVPIKR